jgi:tetratricopeptide (TPR) repeat protein
VTMRSFLPVIATLVLAACGGGPPADPGPPRDIKLDQATSAGTQAMSMELPDVAVRQYKVALARAYERDDSRAIADVAFNLALAQMKAGDAKGAIATAQAAEAELERRRTPVPAELGLVKAAASYRAGDSAGAVVAARQALDRQASDPDTAPRAWFILGLVAAGQEDRATLAQAMAALRPSKSADLEADRLELQGRAALLDGRPAEALTALDQASANRQQALDYRGMARTLAVAGEACVRLDRTAEAAGYFLRAGRSALYQGDTALALPLLRRAEDLAARSGQTAIVDEAARLRRGSAVRASTR